MYIKLMNKKFCFFLDFRACCIIIAYLILFIQTSGLVFALLLCVNTDKITELLKKNKETDMWANVVAIVMATGIMLIVAVMVVLFTVLLIIGLHKEDRRLVRMYLGFSVIMLIISAIFCLISEFTFIAHPTTAHFRVLGIVHGVLFPNCADPSGYLDIASEKVLTASGILNYVIYMLSRRTIEQVLNAYFMYVLWIYSMNLEEDAEKKLKQTTEA